MPFNAFDRRRGMTAALRLLIVAVAWVFIAAPARAEDERAGLPEKLGPFAFAQQVAIERRPSDIVLRYEFGGMRADIFIYRVADDSPDVPDGVDDPVVQAHFRDAMREIYAYAAHFKHPLPEVLGQGITRFGSEEKKAQFIAAELRLSPPETKLRSIIALRGYQGNFLKLRLTMAEVEARFEPEAAPAFLAAFGAHFAERGAI